MKATLRMNLEALHAPNQLFASHARVISGACVEA